ncbi:MAG: hypothetical protein KDD06_16340 [Phaeodactylibacter sp.]|nr:hypothetical protein [Phaeodactylibacter sp.]MCB9266920.1 hypothetical protein [Lewinellaceae bacterium]MCB9285734.1 hypothetical protein [Lewinellaceae bacterium]
MAQKNYLVALLMVVGCLPLTAQQTYDAEQNIYDESKGIVYDHEFTVDMKIHTNGFALGVNFARLKTYYLTRFFNIEIGEIKHDKEFRQSFDFQTPAASRVSRAFIFGKQNNFLVLRGGIGEKRYLSEKAKRKGLAVGLSYEGGPSLGLLKPYYLELVRSSETGPFDDFTIRSEKFSEENASTFLDISRIYGSSGFSKGLGEISVMPGLHGKFAVHFDWGAFDEFVKAIEAGVMVDAYFRDVPIMAESSLVETPENKSVFINLYINLQLGKRW